MTRIGAADTPTYHPAGPVSAADAAWGVKMAIEGPRDDSVAEAAKVAVAYAQSFVGNDPAYGEFLNRLSQTVSSTLMWSLTKALETSGRTDAEELGDHLRGVMCELERPTTPDLPPPRPGNTTPPTQVKPPAPVQPKPSETAAPVGAGAVVDVYTKAVRWRATDAQPRCPYKGKQGEQFRALGKHFGGKPWYGQAAAKPFLRELVTQLRALSADEQKRVFTAAIGNTTKGASPDSPNYPPMSQLILAAAATDPALKALVAKLRNDGAGHS